MTSLSALARAAMEANAQIRGPYTLGSKLFEELTQITMNFRSACSPEAYLELVAERERLEEECLKSMEEIAKLRADLEEADRHSMKLEKLLEPHVNWKDLPAPGDE